MHFDSYASKLSRGVVSIALVAVVALNGGLDAAADTTSDGAILFERGAEQMRAGKLEEAYQTNIRAAGLGHLGAAYNNARIGSLKQRMNVTVFWLAHLWHRIHLSPVDRERFAKSLAADRDLLLLRQDKDYAQIEAIFRGAAPVIETNGPEAKLGPTAFLKSGVRFSWRGIVLEVPAKTQVQRGKVAFKAQAFIMEDPLEVAFSTKRDIVAVHVNRQKTFRGSFVQIVENEHEIATPLNPPPLAGTDTLAAVKGDVLDIVISEQLRLPPEAATYKVYVETDFHRSNIVELEVAAR
jgi:hypothetical protein